MPSADVYSSVSVNPRVVYTDKADGLGIEMVSACGGVEGVGIAFLSNPKIWAVGWVLSKKAFVPGLQMRGLEAIFAAQRSGRGPDSSLKRH